MSRRCNAHVLVVNIYLKINKKATPLSGATLKHSPMRTKKIAALCVLVVQFFACEMPANADGISVSAISHEVLRELDHDPKRFTQGLAVREGRLFESSGLYAQSALFETRLSDNRAVKRVSLPRTVFGEGLALHGDQVQVLSWREQRGFVFDLKLRLLREFRFSGEGWGLASDGRQLIRSDGSSQLSFMDPDTHRDLRRIQVHDGERSVTQLNELEFARGWILANIWHSDRVALIDPADGRVGGWLELGALRQRLPGAADLPYEAVLNGLAYDSAHDLLYVTGKWWPRLFALRVDWPPPPAPSADKR
ncbi:glutaminyl-peptide cyclotransferase [Solimonas sp. K1W22B-7]|uniref:glutaminyl-peptide cyclotransferase n=1 Tax=Solimonas sp. K1W22B-7 TaxID=2303331 RepID=UPI0013C40197|nr:glutaminyl-peptide cyclotransferase [Solimonas sp. K1W22B-7]